MKKKLLLTITLALNIVFANAQLGCVWANTFGGSGDDDSYSVAKDGDGNIYVAGNFQSDSITFDSTTLYNNFAGLADIFLAKFNQTGDFLWVKRAGSNRTDRVRSVCVDPSGNVYITGQFAGTSITFGSTTLTNADFLGDFSDVFVAKYNSAGSVQWAKRIGGDDMDDAYSITSDTNGNIFVTGTFYNTSITVGSYTLTNHDNAGSSMDIFIAKYSGSGSVLWATCEGGTGDDVCNVLKTDFQGNLFAAGNFQSNSMTLGSTTLANTSDIMVFNIKYADGFIAKYDSSNNHLWAKAITGPVLEAVYGLDVDFGGTIYAAGNFFSPTAGIDTASFVNADNTGNSSDVFVVSLNNDGEINWVRQAGGIYNDGCTGLSSSGFGDISICGWFASPVFLYSESSWIENSDNTGNTRDFYLLNYSSGATYETVIKGGGLDDDIATSVIEDPNYNEFILAGMYKSNPSFIGGYTVHTNNGGWDAFVSVVRFFEGIGEDRDVENINSYPNPTHDELFVKSDNNGILSICDINGKLLMKVSVVKGLNTLNVSSIPAGVYLLQLNDGILLRTSKLIKY